jgi:hypothetical protein
MNAHSLRSFSAITSLLALAACGGGEPLDPPADVAQAAADPSSASGRAAALVVSSQDRIAAATATAQSTNNDCAQIRPFYWEVGNRDARLASGSVSSPTSTARYKSTSAMAVASASKWIYAAYAVQRKGGSLSEIDRKFLSMRSGYISLDDCEAGQTVDSCLAYHDNGVYTPSADGVFVYEGGHMQQHASLIGLGSMNSKSLAAAMKSVLGTDLKIAYTEPQIAGGVVTTPDSYARFLRKMLSGQLALGSLLGTSPACTNPTTCKLGEAAYTPVPSSESWHYSIGHWVEDDPASGDGAFSSAGSFGFYPWIDAAKQNYGVIARVAEKGSGEASSMCGRLIRAAWSTGRAM